MSSKTLYENLSIKKLDKSEVEIEADIPSDILLKQWPKALKKLNDSANLPGFRAGHVPDKVLVERYGDIKILEEAADMLFPDIVLDIFQKNVPSAIGRPMISITKIAKGEAIHFKIKTAVIPEVILPDYKSIAISKSKEKNENVVVEEKDVENVLNEMQKALADREKKAIDDVPINDEFVKKIGDFKDLADLKAKIKENITMEKTTRAAEKKRLGLLEAILEKTETELPTILVESELARISGRFEDDISRMGLKPDDYFAHVKKTREDMRKEWLPQAEKNARLDLILATIAKKENIMPDDKTIEGETTHLLSHHKDASPETVRSYVTMALTHQKVFEFLEAQK